MTFPPAVCGHCGQPCGNGQPDPCLGHLPSVVSACCGHGRTSHRGVEHGEVAPYVWLDNGLAYSQAEAVAIMRQLGGNPPVMPYPPSAWPWPKRLSALSLTRA